MNLVNLTASSFFGGPERQMLGLALALPDTVRTTFATFPEGGRGGAFLDEVRQHGFATAPLKNDFPNISTTVREVVRTAHVPSHSLNTMKTWGVGDA